MSYEYDPHNKLKHTSYWFEVDGKSCDAQVLLAVLTLLLTEKAEWPEMKSAQFEAPPEPDEPFDYNAKATAFYLEAEATGSVPVRDVIEEVSESCPGRERFALMPILTGLPIARGQALADYCAIARGD